MANQLSVQMTGAVLNINLGPSALLGGCGTGGFLPCLTGTAASASDMIYAPGTACAKDANLGGYATLGCVIDEANYAILQKPYTPSGNTATCPAGSLGTVNCRIWQGALQTALNNANNNKAGANPGPEGIRLCGINYTGVNACVVTPSDHP
jgi:hypothetical protein